MPVKRISQIVFALILLAVPMCSCIPPESGGTGPPGAVASATVLETLAAILEAPEAQAQGEALVDDLGRPVTIDEVPQRIVSLAPSITETLFALGLGDRVVGVTEHCDYPAEAQDKPSVGGYFTTSLEAIVAQEPDVVFTDGHDPVGAQLEALGITLVVLQPQDIAGVLSDIMLVGQVTGTEREADELINELKVRIAVVAVRTAAVSERPTVFYEIDASGEAENKPWTVGPGSFIDTMITLAGGENIVAVSQAYLQISLEEIVDADPDMVILGDYPWIQPDDVAARPGAWQVLSAVEGGAVYAIDPDLTSRPGPRIVDGLEEMARIIHPELFP